ncbi:MAG: hypothetical protein PVF51_00735 [Nitrospirota bacterium]|jgi:hypothetical protein
MSTHTTRATCLAAGILLSSCLAGSDIVTDDFTAVYVPPDAAEHQLRITGTTATVPNLKPFAIDDPIVYDLETTCGKASLVESKTYTNADGDEIRFRTKYDKLTGESWRSVVVHPRADEDYELMRLPDYLDVLPAKVDGGRL